MILYSIKSILIFALVLLCLRTAAQPKIVILDSGHKVSLRGLSVVNDHTVWASGSKGTVAKSLDGGKNFEWMQVKGYETRDFRDVEAFNADTALIMAVDLPALILKTKDGGSTWKEVFRDTTKGMFLDAMDFRDNGSGVVVGDPVANKPFLAHTYDGGEHWLKLEGKAKEILPTLDSGEAFFASSGTNIIELPVQYQYRGQLLMVSGGINSELLSEMGFLRESMPIIQGKSSTGANSVAFNFNDSTLNNVVIVGGDFLNDSARDHNCVLVKFGGAIKTSFPQTPPHGYRSCVAFLTKDKLITCGTSGVDISNDGGQNWQLISRQSFHVCQKAKKGSAVFLAGANGKIAAYR